MAGFGGIIVLVPFQSASIVAASGGKLFLVPLQSASIAAASGGKLFWFLSSQHLLWLNLAGD